MNTALQPALFTLEPTVTPQYSKGATIQERFEQFHASNPHVYEALRKLALEMRGRGIPRYSIKGLFEQLRWLYALQTQGEEYKLSNDLTSRYVRLLIERNPELNGFFSTRELRTE